MCRANRFVILWALPVALAFVQSDPSGSSQLRPGTPIEREIKPGETHRYSVSLEQGQFLGAVVIQRGIDLVIDVIDPSGKKLSEVDSPNGAEGPEPVTVAPAVSGVFQIHVRPFEGSAKPGRYDIKIEELLTAPEYSNRLSAERTAADATRTWVAANAIPLKTVGAGHGFADMQPLKKFIGSAKVVALGEATHGTREFFQMKHRFLEFLVTQMGFNIFGIEATMPESFDINEYVLTGEGDPSKALAGIYFWTWDTQEVLELIEWMRRYNADPLHKRKVKFYGFDMQFHQRAAKVTLAYLKKVDPQAAESAKSELALLSNPYLEPRFNVMSGETKSALNRTLKGVLASFDGRKQQYISRSSVNEWALVRQHAQVLAQAVDLRTQEFMTNADLVIRETAMAENIRWVLQHEGPDAKAVLWAHNGHVATNDASKEGGVRWMGSHLRQMFGSEMVVFGFMFNQGGFQAVEAPFPSKTGLRQFTVPAAPPGTLDAMLASAGLKIAAVDLRTLPKDGPVAEWFSKPRGSRNIGAGFGEPVATNGIYPVVAPHLYDALLFVETTTPAIPVNKTDGPGPQQRLTRAENADFEAGEPDKAPPHWQIPTKLARFDFEVITSTERPYSGHQCAIISRSPGRHYGETAGGLTQQLEAASFRGKKIRLRAAARADLPDGDNGAWLRLRVLRKGFGPQAVAFDSYDNTPVASRDWRVYEVTAEIPKDAESISYGLSVTGDGKAWLDAVQLETID
jgi:erythromycin esterase